MKDSLVLWYNDIEDGFNVSRFTTWGAIPDDEYWQRGKSFPLLQRLARLRKAGNLAAWPVWVKSGETWIAGRVCAIRKSKDAIDRAQRRLTLKEQTGKTVSSITRQYAEYVLVFTTLPDTDASVEQVTSSRKRPTPSSWREFQFALHQVLASVTPQIPLSYVHVPLE